MSKSSTSFTKADVKVLKKESLYEGFFTLNKYHLKHKLFDGGESRLVIREVFERGHAAAVLPYDPILDELVLLEQFRFPAMETNNNPWLIEVVAGIVEEGEDFEEVCHREAQEEAGIILTKLIKMNSYLASPGACTERIHVYLGKVDASSASGIHGLDNEAEDIKVLRVPFDEAVMWLNEGKIDNSTAIIAIQWLMLNKHKVRQDWGQQ
ncbi:MAG: ADP-ribose pyrophosphatase [Alphaproteobacteria bacterium]|jgi:ADP-ribose pyrophosphatase